MNQRIVESMIAEGYSGIQIAEFEKCDHVFKRCAHIDPYDCDFIVDVMCDKCKCDSHVANVMGIDPMYYNEVDVLK